MVYSLNPMVTRCLCAVPGVASLTPQVLRRNIDKMLAIVGEIHHRIVYDTWPLRLAELRYAETKRSVRRGAAEAPLHAPKMRSGAPGTPSAFYGNTQLGRDVLKTQQKTSRIVHRPPRMLGDAARLCIEIKSDNRIRHFA